MTRDDAPEAVVDLGAKSGEGLGVESGGVGVESGGVVMGSGEFVVKSGGTGGERGGLGVESRGIGVESGRLGVESRGALDEEPEQEPESSAPVPLIPPRREVVAKDVALPPRVETSAASNLRKEQVRAALFGKLEPLRIGRFVLIEPLGAGAMGEIYAAYDDRLDRKVALKLVRSGSELQADERLLREAQTLAQVSHPNVVQIYEAGTYNGRLFIAMELIRGKTLSAWLREAAQLPRAVRQREILRQFIAAGRGLEAAHAAGVAHRDFKPDNVLVGDDGRVRVVDFGLARALGEELESDAADGTHARNGAQSAEASKEAIGSGPTVMMKSEPPDRGDASSVPLVTGASTIDHPPPAPPRPARDSRVKRGRAARRDDRSSRPRLKAAVRLTQTGTVLGTPSFMAPEQMRGAVADRRSDQFSFCVALYYALYDTFPFSGRSLRELFDSMETDEVEFASDVPVPTFVRRALHRGLSVDPAHRFPGMGELLAALEPKRRRRGWIAAATAVVALVVGAGVHLRSQAEGPCAAASTAIDVAWAPGYQASMRAAFARSQLPFAESAWRGTKERLDEYARRWRDGATAACQATHVAHTQSAEQLDKRMLCLDRGRRGVAALVAELVIATPDAVEHAIEAAGSLPETDTCSRAENLLFGVAPPPASIADDVAKMRDRLAQAEAQGALGRHEEALVIARDTSVRTERLGYPPVHAEALVQVASALFWQSTSVARGEAQRLYFQALTIAEAQRHDQLVSGIWRKLVTLAIQMDSSMAQAHEWWQQAHAWSQRNMATVGVIGNRADDPPDLHFRLGEIYYRESEYAKAAEEERLAIAAVPPTAEHALELVAYKGALAMSLQRLDALDEAVRLLEQALATATETFGAGHPIVVTLEINYSRALSKSGRLDRARAVLEGALVNMPAHSRDSHSSAAQIHSLLSDIDCADGHLDRAAEHARISLQIYDRTLSPDHVKLAQAYIALGNVEFKRRNFENALTLFRHALSLRRRHFGDDHHQVGLGEGYIAETLVNLERPDEAMAHLVEAERIFARSSDRERDTREWILTVRGEILLSQRKFEPAVPVLEQALTLSRADSPDPTNHALAMWTLARVLENLGRDRERVYALAERAHTIFTSLGAVEAYDRDVVACFLNRLSPRFSSLGCGPAQ